MFKFLIYIFGLISLSAMQFSALSNVGSANFEQPAPNLTTEQLIHAAKNDNSFMNILVNLSNLSFPFVDQIQAELNEINLDENLFDSNYTIFKFRNSMRYQIKILKSECQIFKENYAGYNRMKSKFLQTIQEIIANSNIQNEDNAILLIAKYGSQSLAQQAKSIKSQNNDSALESSFETFIEVTNSLHISNQKIINDYHYLDYNLQLFMQQNAVVFFDQITLMYQNINDIEKSLIEKLKQTKNKDKKTELINKQIELTAIKASVQCLDISKEKSAQITLSNLIDQLYYLMMSI